MAKALEVVALEHWASGMELVLMATALGAVALEHLASGMELVPWAKAAAGWGTALGRCQMVMAFVASPAFRGSLASARGHFPRG